MSESGSMSESSCASLDISSHWTSIVASNPELVSLNRQNVDFLMKYDPYLVSLGRKIGEGGQGSIYEANFHTPYSFQPLPVAVKKFKKFEGVSQGRIPVEMASWNSQNLCTPLGVFFEGHSLCTIMPRFSCDLRSAINTRMRAMRNEAFGTNASPFTERGATTTLLQLATSLKALHECGVHHGDLKAANILLRVGDKNDDASALDFVYLALADFERSDNVVGTGFFRAPEVLQSLLTRVPLSTEQWLLADVYSFGMVCYEVMTGSIPFEGHPQSDYDLVFKGARPEIPAHVPQSWRDLILRCWQADPESRPSWEDIVAVIEQNDDALHTVEVISRINGLVSVESLSFESLIHELEQTIQTVTALHERNSKTLTMDFMPAYWASQLVATAKEYASKFEVDSSGEHPLICSPPEFMEMLMFSRLLGHQIVGSTFGLVALLFLIWEGDRSSNVGSQEVRILLGRLQGMERAVCMKVLKGLRSVQIDYEVGTPWIGKLCSYHAVVKRILWYEHDDGFIRKLLMPLLWPTCCSLSSLSSLSSLIDRILIFFIMMGNAYFYVLAMITWEPFLLGLQYWLYKTKGSKSALYRSSGERICRFQRAWMNCRRFKVVGILLSISFPTLPLVYGWRGILGWIFLPSVVLYTPYWHHPFRTDQ